MYYSLLNMDKSNNCFSYSPYLHPLWFDIYIPKGSYHVEDINEFIQREMRKNGQYDRPKNEDYIETSANIKTLESEMIIKNNYEVDFTQDNSINSLLGFHSKRYTSGFHESENMVNILTINSILVNIDII